MISCKVNKNKVKHAEFCDVLLPYHEGTVGRLLMPFYFSDVERLRLFFRRTLCQCFFLRRLDNSLHFWHLLSFVKDNTFFGVFFLNFFLCFGCVPEETPDTSHSDRMRQDFTRLK